MRFGTAFCPWKWTGRKCKNKATNNLVVSVLPRKVQTQMQTCPSAGHCNLCLMLHKSDSTTHSRLGGKKCVKRGRNVGDQELTIAGCFILYFWRRIGLHSQTLPNGSPQPKMSSPHSFWAVLLLPPLPPSSSHWHPKAALLYVTRHCKGQCHFSAISISGYKPLYLSLVELTFLLWI